MIGFVATDNVGSDAVTEEMVTILMPWAADACLILVADICIDR